MCHRTTTSGGGSGRTPRAPSRRRGATAGKSGLDPKRLADDDEAVLKDLVERHFRHWDGRMVISGQL
jgi:hypothetical protein